MKAADVKKVCALGTGAMGAGTALRFAEAGCDVTMWARSDESLERGLAAFKAAIASRIKHGLLDPVKGHAALDRLTLTTDLAAAAADSDVVIESIAEDLPLKRGVFSILDKLCPERTVFMTNTSSLMPTDIAKDMNEAERASLGFSKPEIGDNISDARKQKLIVTHMWNPPHLLRLSEVVPSKFTSDDTKELAYDVMERIGMKAVHVDYELPGFVGNRLQLALLREALAVYESGEFSKEDIDREVQETFALSMGRTGPMKGAAVLGDDVLDAMIDTHVHTLSVNPGIPKTIDEAFVAGNHGAKTGQGIYTWDKAMIAELGARREGTIVKHLMADLAEESGFPSHAATFDAGRPMSALASRLFLAVYREARHIESIGAASADNIDLVFTETMGRRLSETGPLISACRGGLDVFHGIFESTGADLCTDTNVLLVRSGQNFGSRRKAPSQKAAPADRLDA